MSHRILFALQVALVAVAFFVASSSRAADAPLVVAGGALDPAFTGADVYVGLPPPAPRPSGKACVAAQKYLDLINAGQYDKVVDLFEPDGVVLDPARAIVRGHAGLRAFYTERIRKLAPRLVGVALVGDDRDCMLEIAALQPVGGTERYVLVSVDHFTVGESGKFTRMVAFARPPRRE